MLKRDMVVALALMLAAPLAASRLQGPSDLISGASTRGLIAVDLDKDGASELVSANFGTDSFIGVSPAASAQGSIQIFKNDHGILSVFQTLATGLAPRGLASADLNGDGRPDLLATYYGSDQVAAYLQGADGKFGSPQVLATGAGPVGVDALVKDGHAFVAVANNASASVSLYAADATGHLSFRATLASGNGPTDARFIKNNRFAKLVSVNTSGSLTFWDISADGNATDKTELSMPGYPCKAAVADLNADGYDDLVVSLFSDAKVAILYSQSGEFTSEALRVPLTGGTPNGVALASLGKGQRPAIATADRDSDKVDLIRAAEDGSYTRSLSLTAQDAPYSDPNLPSKFGPVEAAFGDFNGDGRVDLAVSHMRSGKIKLFLQLQPGAPVISSSSHPDPRSAYAEPHARFSIEKPLDIDGIDHLNLVFDQLPGTIPGPDARHSDGEFDADNLETGTYYLHAAAVDKEGNQGDTAHFKVAVTAEMSAANTYNFPNPTRSGRTSIRFPLLAPADVKLRIYDEFSNLVWSKDLSAGQTAAGVNIVEWDGRNDRGAEAANGGYILQVLCGRHTITKKIAIVR